MYCGIYFPRDGSKLGDYLGVIKAKKLKLRFFSDDKNEKPNEHLINMGDLLKEKEIKELTVNVGKGHCADISVRIVEYLHDNSKVDMTAENVSWDLLDSNKK